MASIQSYRPANEQKCHKPSSNQQQGVLGYQKPSSNHGVGQQGSSLGQKVSEMAGFLKGRGGHRNDRMHGQPHGRQPHTTTTHTTCYSQTVTYQTPQHQGLGGHKHHVGGTTTTTTSNGAVACSGKSRRTTRGDGHKKERDSRNLFQKIKDGISGDSSCSDSESDSDNEGNCRNHKNYMHA